MQVFLKIFQTLSSKGKTIWITAVILGILASLLEVASAATFSLLTSALFGGRNSNFGILAKSLPFAITQSILIAILAIIFISKLGFQWIELNLKTRSAEEFYLSIFRKKASRSQGEIEKSDSPVANLANRMHVLTHNIYYPAGLVISELLILIFLIPFVIYISPKASLLVFGTTLLLSIPALSVVRKRITTLNQERMSVDLAVDYITYSNFRTFYDQGFLSKDEQKLNRQIHKASEIDRKIVKLGSYSRITIEFSFIVSVILTFSLIDKLVEPQARIQFFAIIAYSFFRVIPAFSRIIAARNQIASHQFEFFELMQVDDSLVWRNDQLERNSFEKNLLFSFPRNATSETPLEIGFSIRDFAAIKGETGVGKTTLLKTIGGLIQSDFKLEIDGMQIPENVRWAPKVALVSQNPFLSGGTLHEMITGQEDLSNVDSLIYKESLEISALSEWIKLRPDSITNENISGGERKQIALARAIYLKPEILLLDEVTAGMDPDLAEKILRNLLDSSKFKLVLLATHDSIMERKFSQIIYL